MAEKDLFQDNRTVQKARAKVDILAKSEAYRVARRTLRHAIIKSNSKCWRKLRKDIDFGPLGLGYKIVTQKLKAYSPSFIMEEATISQLVQVLFPLYPLRLMFTLEK